MSKNTNGGWRVGRATDNRSVTVSEPTHHAAAEEQGGGKTFEDFALARIRDELDAAMNTHPGFARAYFAHGLKPEAELWRVRQMLAAERKANGTGMADSAWCLLDEERHEAMEQMLLAILDGAKRDPASAYLRIVQARGELYHCAVIIIRMIRMTVFTNNKIYGYEKAFLRECKKLVRDERKARAK